MKKLMNLKGASALSTLEQKEIKGGIRPILIECQVGCAGKGPGDSCFAASNCNCPGICNSQECIAF